MVNPNPIQDSKRSQRRRARGFRSLEVSSRRHRRAERRLAISQTIEGTRHKAGTPVALGLAKTKGLTTHHAGGAYNYH